MEFRFIMYNYHKKVTVYFFKPYSGDSQAKTSVESKGEKGFMIASIFILPPSLLNTKNEQYIKKVFGLSENVIDFSTLP